MAKLDPNKKMLILRLTKPDTIISIFMYVDTYVSIEEFRTHNSESRGQEEAGCMRRMHELFTHTHHWCEIC